MSHYRILTVLVVAELIGCQRTADIECYAMDSRSPVVWAEVEDPVSFLTDEYCGRGMTTRTGFDRNLIWHCVPSPGSCEPCLLESDDVELEFRKVIAQRFSDAGCPSDYDPEEIVPGCMLEIVETNECCWSGEYFTDPEVCDPSGSNQSP
jgi:hypothetical protein